VRLLCLLCVLPVLTACATLTAESDQTITLHTTPQEGAVCIVTGEGQTITSDPTPTTVTVTRAFEPLHIQCDLPGIGSGSATANAGTRGRTYGNILLAGIPALVDAYNGKGYEYADTITIPLSAEGTHITVEP